MHRSHQLAFDLDVESVLPGQVMIGRPPDHLPDRDREAAVTQMASLTPGFMRPAGGSMMISSAASSPKVLGTHRHRLAVVSVRRSTVSQVERNTESTDRQYALQERAVLLGRPRESVRIIDADLGRSGASTTGRSGFAELTTMVGLGQVGIVLTLEVSRLARNNSDWYLLLDLAGIGCWIWPG